MKLEFWFQELLSQTVCIQWKYEGVVTEHRALLMMGWGRVEKSLHAIWTCISPLESLQKLERETNLAQSFSQQQEDQIREVQNDYVVATLS